MIVFACPSRPAAFVCLCHRAASFTYFGEVLRCPHKRIVTITKVYIARNTIHVEIMIPYKLARLVTFESLKWKYSFATNSTLFMKLAGRKIHAGTRHYAVLPSVMKPLKCAEGARHDLLPCLDCQNDPKSFEICGKVHVELTTNYYSVPTYLISI